MQPRKRRRTQAELRLCNICTINVICQNKIHRITLRKSGHVTLHNHNPRAELQALKLCKSLGVETPKCVKILQYWKDYPTSTYSGNYVPRRSRKHISPELPPEVYTMRVYAKKRYKDEANGHYDSRRHNWMRNRCRNVLELQECRLGSSVVDGRFTIASRKHFGIVNKYCVNHWIFRMYNSGLTHAVPLRFPVAIIRKDGCDWLTMLTNRLEVERVNITNGNCPSTITSGESQARFDTALRKYRLMESTSRGDHCHPDDGG